MSIRNELGWNRCGMFPFIWFWILTLAFPGLRAATNETLSILTNAEQVLNLTRTQTAQGFPIHLQGVITCYQLSSSLCFVQDHTAGIYVYAQSADLDVKLGDQVVLEGISGAGSYSPIVYQAKIKRLGAGVLPTPKRVPIQALSNGKEDSQWVEVEGIVRKQVESGGELMLELVLNGDRLKMGVLEYPPKNYPHLVDAKVRVQGVVASQQNKKRQIVGCYLLVPTLDQIQILEPGLADPFQAPLRPATELMSYSRSGASEHLVRVSGIVTLQVLGKTLFISAADGGIQIQSSQQTIAHPGDRIEAAGFAERGDYSPVLRDGSFRIIASQKPPTPTPILAARALTGEYDNELVQLEAEVIGQDETAEAKILLLEAEKKVVRAQWDSHSRGFGSIPKGSKVSVVGICKVQIDPEDQPMSFSLWLRSPDDVMVLQAPSWWRLRQVIWLAIIVLLVVAWAVTLNYRVLQRTQRIRLREGALEKRYLELFQNANDIIYTHDLSGKLTSLNKAGERILGYTEEEAKAKNMSELLAPEQQNFSMQEIQPVMIRSPVTHREVQVISKDGKTLFLEVTSRPQYENDRLVGVQGIARDISARRQAEAALRASEQELRESLEERERIGRDLHDGIIQGIYAVGLHLEDCRRLAREKSSDLDRKLVTILDDLSGIIRQVRNFIGGIESEDLKGGEFKAALKSLILTLGETRSARFSLAIDSLAAESLNPTQATQLLHISREAMSNAVRHADAEKTTLSLHRHGNRLKFEICDDGTGFNSQEGDQHGHGLRNMAARAEEMGATFKIISQVGEGTRIVLDIPSQNHHQSA